jgi:two-component system response regulator FixJ
MDEQQKVALVDDDHAILDSLQICLQRRGFQVGCYDSAREFLQEIDAGLATDCAVSDIKMPGMNGLALQRALSQKRPFLPLILITGHGDVDMAVEAMKAGAFDFIEKPIDDRRLTTGIGKAIAQYRRSLADQEELITVRSRYLSLSQRQQQVVDLAVQGLSSKEIALRLGLSPRTVEHYREYAMERMRADSLADLVAMAVRLKMASPTER